jgi:hypothetical protein
MKMAKPRCGNKDFDLHFSSSRFLNLKKNDYSTYKIISASKWDVAKKIIFSLKILSWHFCLMVSNLTGIPLIILSYCDRTEQVLSIDTST